MTKSLPLCPHCQMVLPGSMINTRELAPCPNCGKKMDVRVYAAYFRSEPVGSAGELVMVDGEASCFYHPQKRAAVPCDACGRFLCSLCDVDVNGKHICPTCIDSGQKKGKIVELENQRILWDSAALGMALLPLLTVFGTIVTAPAAVVMGVMALKKPSSIIPRTRVRIYLAFLFAGAEIAAWIFLGIQFLQGATR
jgi:hypothetical protein